jgi:hypothetical protein
VTDRLLLPRLPDIKLADLARPVDRPLKRPRRRREQRPDLSQVVVDDGLARGASQRLKQLADANAGQLRIVFQQPVDLRPERAQAPRFRRPRIARRPIAPERPPDRVARQPRPLASSLIGLPPTKCSRRSLTHYSTLTTPSAASSSLDHDEAQHHPGQLRRPAEGVGLRPAEGGQFSGYETAPSSDAVRRAA